MAFGREEVATADSVEAVLSARVEVAAVTRVVGSQLVVDSTGCCVVGESVVVAIPSETGVEAADVSGKYEEATTAVVAASVVDGVTCEKEAGDSEVDCVVASVVASVVVSAAAEVGVVVTLETSAVVVSGMVEDGVGVKDVVVMAEDKASVAEVVTATAEDGVSVEDVVTARTGDGVSVEDVVTGGADDGVSIEDVVTARTEDGVSVVVGAATLDDNSEVGTAARDGVVSKVSCVVDGTAMELETTSVVGGAARELVASVDGSGVVDVLTKNSEETQGSVAGDTVDGDTTTGTVEEDVRGVVVSQKSVVAAEVVPTDTSGVVSEVSGVVEEIKTLWVVDGVVAVSLGLLVSTTGALIDVVVGTSNRFVVLLDDERGAAELNIGLFVVETTLMLLDKGEEVAALVSVLVSTSDQD